MSNLKKWLSILLVSLLAFTLAACSGNSESSSGDSSGSGTKLTFWAPFSGADGPKMKEIVENYNKSQDDYNVKLQIVPQSEYYKTVDLAINGEKNMPDFLIMHEDQLLTYVNKDVLKDLDDVVGDDIKKEDYHPKAWEGATVNDKLYAVPLDIHPLMLYWNKDMFKEAGLDPDTPPKTRDEFINFAKKLTDKDKRQYGYVVPTLWPQQFIFPSIVAQNGGNLMKDGELQYTTDPVVEALQFERDLIDKYKVSPSDVSQDGEVTMFLQGKNAMQLNGPWMMNQFEEAGINYGVAPVPQLGTEKQAVFANSHTFVIPKQVEDQDKIDGITDFLGYVKENGMAWAESGQAPASKAVYESDEFQKMKQQPQVAKQFDDVVFSPRVENWGQISEPLYQAINEVLLGQKDAKEALKEAQQKAQGSLK
ncbi:ABC transporter substrate-binding protein [Halobacillus rhizosphaerae]|uniref:ABC transporter substrate-binding protein n=1 Tax=Halobacillus rhizosphaerae TaxID=3064889 RepID=UPI00398B1934